MSLNNIPIFYILFLMLPIGVGFFGVVHGQLDDTGLETSTHWNEYATTTLSPQQLCELKGEAWNWTLISECYNKYADCESGKNITECSESDLKRTEMGCGCANDYTFNKNHECVLADQCWNTWQKKDHCESNEKGIWTNLDTCLEEQPSCENQNPKRKEVCDENEKIPGCQCKPNQFHSNYNKTSGISYGPCLDVEGCKQVMIANKIEKAKPIEFPPPVDGIDEDYDAVGWEDYGKMNYNKIIIR